MNKEILEKYYRGDWMTDEELLSAYDHFKTLQEYLGKLGNMFYLPWKEVTHILNRLHSYGKSRKLIQ